MSVYLAAPWDLIQATVMLPSPNLGDLTTNQSLVTIRNSMSGVHYSYIKSTDRIKKVWEFVLRRAKALELEQFIEYYSEQEIRVFDVDFQQYRMFITNNPVDFTRVNKDQITTVRLELEGYLLT